MKERQHQEFADHPTSSRIDRGGGRDQGFLMCTILSEVRKVFIASVSTNKLISLHLLSYQTNFGLVFLICSDSYLRALWWHLWIDRLRISWMFPRLTTPSMFSLVSLNSAQLVCVIWSNYELFWVIWSNCELYWVMWNNCELVCV